MPSGALAGIRLVEVAGDTTAVGAGLASNLPGSILRDLGADVVHVRSRHRSTLDNGVQLERAWDRGKDVVEADDVLAAARDLAPDADVLVVSGTEDVPAANPRCVQVRIRPGRDALGVVPDLELLVAARAGLLTQIRGNRPGP